MKVEGIYVSRFANGSILLRWCEPPVMGFVAKGKWDLFKICIQLLIAGLFSEQVIPKEIAEKEKK
jgi:hypothetical protein